MLRLKIRNWEKFQHYSKRNPPWIKLHFSILQSKDWVSASNEDRVLAIAIMLIASHDHSCNGSFDADSEYIKRVAYLDFEPNFKRLINLGFLELVQADASICEQMQADARPETETETEEKKNMRSRAGNYSEDFEVWWKMYPAHRKPSKHEAYKQWKLQKVNGSSVELIDKLSKQIASKIWDDGHKYCPNAQKYLKERRWEDDLPAEQESKLGSWV